MRIGGQILDEILIDLMNRVEVGITTWDLEARARQIFREKKVEPAFLGYKNFPAALCTSINEEVVHGIPSPKKFLRAGDLLKIDAGLCYEGFYVDAARTVGVGELDDVSLKLKDVAFCALDRGIQAARCGNRLGDISNAIQREVEAAGFSVVREYTGHGIGRKLHESPQVPNFGPPNSGPRLKPGMVFALEPMVNAGSWETRVLNDEWTVITADGKRSSHAEQTIVVTENGPEILTRLQI
ncbi:type I methionyl aminopeptidase [Candidatus Sumerlaeota bacterium]|nr:type I methionyl aminopeptidase [Candidatus Sumerlaeota bacterium]